MAIISEEQKKEIEKLAVEHGAALVAFGGDMYRKGLIKGGLCVAGGMFLGEIISYGYDYIKAKLKRKENKK